MVNMLIVDDIIRNALIEDMNYMDLASELAIDEGSTSEGVVTAKDDGVVCGLFIFERVFRALSDDVKVEILASEGESVKRGQDICRIVGNTRSILKGERVSLNIVQRMSGIATLASEFSRIAGKHGVKVVDTRKTTPGLRILEKYAVTKGGCFNHRFNLSDMVMLKDNHIFACGSITGAVSKVREATGHSSKIEVEVENLVQFEEALRAGADIVMLDNMSNDDMKKAVGMAKSMFGDSALRPVVEASGNVSLDTVEAIAMTGVDIISCGMLTHSVKAFDISLNLNMEKRMEI